MYSGVVHTSPVTQQILMTTKYCSWQALIYVCRRTIWWRNMGVHCPRQLNYVCGPTHALGECTLTSLSNGSWYSSLTLIIRVHSVYILRQLLTKIIENLWYDDWMNMEDWKNNTQSGKPKYSNKNLYHSRIIHQKSHKEHGLASKWIWPSVIRGHQITAQTMAWPSQNRCPSFVHRK